MRKSNFVQSIGNFVLLEGLEIQGCIFISFNFIKTGWTHFLLMGLLATHGATFNYFDLFGFV